MKSNAMGRGLTVRFYIIEELSGKHHAWDRKASRSFRFSGRNLRKRRSEAGRRRPPSGGIRTTDNTDFTDEFDSLIRAIRVIRGSSTVTRIPPSARFFDPRIAGLRRIHDRLSGLHDCLSRLIVCVSRLIVCVSRLIVCLSRLIDCLRCGSVRLSRLIVRVSRLSVPFTGKSNALNR
jgi:hypothetical protein